MDNERRLMKFYFITTAEISTHYHQNLELFYVLQGELEIKMDDQTYCMRKGDILLVNANKQHRMNGNKELLAVRFEIDFHLLAEHMGTMQLLFWCNTIVDKNAAYAELRQLLDRILTRYFEKDEKGALHLNALYFETLYLLTSNFLVKSDDARLNLENSQDRQRIRQIQNYIQANYQTQISLNDLADRLYLSNAYLSKYVKKHLGLTFMEYLNNVRLFHAVDELLYTQKNMTHIALDNGFPTSAAFTKAFRDIYGEAPSEYRKRMQEQEPADPEKELTEEESVRIQKYLAFKEKEDEPEVKNLLESCVDAKAEGHRLKEPYKAVCIGEAYSVLQSDVQEQLKQLQRAAGIRYARIWNVFPREESVGGKERNFRRIDQVIDFLLENNMKPYIELGHKQTVFLYNPDKILKEAEVIQQYPLDELKRIVREFAQHLVNRYGMEELESWYFEYWKVSPSKVTQPDGEYYAYFDAIYGILKSISPEIRVGGAGMILGYETEECRTLLDIWSKREIHPDFVSCYSYQYNAVIDNGNKYGRKSIDVDYVKNQVSIIREIMNEVGFSDKELHLSEWNFTVSNRNLLNDSCNHGAYILKNAIEMEEEVDVLSYWHALDSYSDYYDASQILNGDSGTISRDGIYKPSLYAFSFMNRLLPKVIYKDKNMIVTTNGRGRFMAACHNFKRLSSKYVFTDEDQIELEELDNYIEDSEPLKIRLQLEQVKNGNYQVKVHCINKESGSVQDIWKQLEYGKNLARDEMYFLKKSSIPRMEIHNFTAEDQTLEMEYLLLEQEIRLLDIQYQFAL